MNLQTDLLPGTTLHVNCQTYLGKMLEAPVGEACDVMFPGDFVMFIKYERILSDHGEAKELTILTKFGIGWLHYNEVKIP